MLVVDDAYAGLGIDPNNVFWIESAASSQGASFTPTHVVLTNAEYEELQDPTGLPKLTLEQGAQIAGAILLIWAIGFGARALKRAM